MGDGVWVTFANYGVSDVSLYAKIEVEKLGITRSAGRRTVGTGHPSAQTADPNLFGAIPRVGFAPFFAILTLFLARAKRLFPTPRLSASPSITVMAGEPSRSSAPPQQNQLKLGRGARVFLTHLFSLNIDLFFAALEEREAQTPSCFGPALSQRSLEEGGGGNAGELSATPAPQRRSFASAVNLPPPTIEVIWAKGLFCCYKLFYT